MHDKILQLAVEAGVHHINYDEDYSANFEKFAELLVRECAKVSLDQWCENGEEQSAENAILKHFGVEE